MKHIRIIGLLIAAIAGIASLFGVKLTGPMFSLTASGTLADTVTYDKRGHARVRVIPQNPQSQGQVDARQRVTALQTVIPQLDTAAIDVLKTASPTPYRWLSYALGKVIGANGSAYDAATSAFAGFSSPEKAYWNDDAAAFVIPTTAYGEFAPTHVPSNGEVLYAIAVAAFANGWQPGTPIDEPAATSESADDWAAFLLGA